MNPEIDLVEFVEHEDGSVNLKLNMSFDMLVILARRGLQALFEEATEEHGYPNPEGDSDADARAGRDSELFGEIPEL